MPNPGTKRIRFIDATIDLDPEGVAAQVYRLYQAAFNREPDKDGLGFWINTVEQSALPLEQVAAALAGSDEFKRLYPNLDNRGFVERVYQNVLHRQGDAAGIEWYLNNINRGAVTREQVLLAISDSAENKAQVAPKIALGVEWTLPAALCTPTQAVGYGKCAERPRVVSVLPQTGATGVSTVSSILVEFDQAMETNVWLDPKNVTVTPAFDALEQDVLANGFRVTNSVLKFNPYTYTLDNQLRPYTTYTVTLQPAGALSAAGTRPAAPVSFSFTTGACHFGEAHNGRCTAECTPPKKLLGDQTCGIPATGCEPGWYLQDGICVGESQLPPCPAPQVRVDGVCTNPAPVCDAPKTIVNGVCTNPAPAPSPMPNPAPVPDPGTPSTPTPPPGGGTTPSGQPAIIASYPGPDAKGLVGPPLFGAAGNLKTVWVAFDRDMDLRSFSDSIFLRDDASASQVEGSWRFEKNTATFTAYATGGLPVGRYSLTVGPQIKDTRGVAFGQVYGYAIDVGGSHVTVSPSHGASEVPVTTQVTAKFNVPANPATVNGTSFSLSHDGIPVDGAVTATSGVATFTPSTPLQNGVLYRARLSSAVTSAAGAALQAYEWTFRTVFAPPPVTPTPAPAPGPAPAPSPAPPSSGSGNGKPDAQGCWTPADTCVSGSERRANGSLYATFRNQCSARLLIKICIQQSTGGQFCSGPLGTPAGASAKWDALNGTRSASRFIGSNNPNNDVICANRGQL